ncbi:hypothetical protein BDZ97DRAFT_882216 [Flammula alnicola]|nr:hypothetical protein BDZ97DRAFT_882216 [Flammula alnicola]
MIPLEKDTRIVKIPVNRAFDTLWQLSGVPRKTLMKQFCGLFLSALSNVSPGLGCYHRGGSTSPSTFLRSYDCRSRSIITAHMKARNGPLDSGRALLFGMYLCIAICVDEFSPLVTAWSDRSAAEVLLRFNIPAVGEEPDLLPNNQLHISSSHSFKKYWGSRHIQRSVFINSTNAIQSY